MRGTWLKLDLHNHTWYSGDAIISPHDFIARSKSKGVVLAITDHNHAKAWKALERESRLQQWPFIRGQEQKVYWERSFAGELIGLFLQEPLQSRQVWDVLDEIHAQDGLVMLPHPFDNRSVGGSPGFVRLEEIMGKVDVVEGFNARIRRAARNETAMQWALQYHKPVSAGSDAHLPWEISNAWVEVNADLIEEARRQLCRGTGKITGKRTHPINLVATQFFRLPPVRAMMISKKSLQSKRFSGE